MSGVVEHKQADEMLAKAREMMQMLADEYGMNMRVTTAKFSSVDLRLGFEFKNLDSAGASVDEIAFRERAPGYGIPADAFGKTLKLGAAEHGNRRMYKIIGWDTRPRAKYKVLVVDSAGDKFRFRAEDVATSYRYQHGS